MSFIHANSIQKLELDVVSEVKKTRRYGDQDNTILSALLVAYITVSWLAYSLMFYAMCLKTLVALYMYYLLIMLISLLY